MLKDFDGVAGSTEGAEREQPLGRPKLIVACDTANEIDDLYTILRMLRQDRFDVLTLNSTQWFHSIFWKVAMPARG